MMSIRKILLVVLISSGCTLGSNAQCNLVSNGVLDTDSNWVRMFTSADYYMTPSSANQFHWILSHYNGDFISQHTEKFPVLNLYAIDTLEIIKICQNVYNTVTDITCQVCDSLRYQNDGLYWQLHTSNRGMDLTSISRLSTTHLNSFPNPAIDWVKIQYPSIENKEIELRVYNYLGAISNPNYFIQKDEIKIQTNELLDGLYFVEVIIDSQQRTLSRFLKQ